MSTQSEESALLESLDFTVSCGLDHYHPRFGSGSAEWALWIQSPCGQAWFSYSCYGCFEKIKRSSGTRTTCTHCEKGVHDGSVRGWIKKAKYLR